MQSVPITTNNCQFESFSWWGVLDTPLYDQVCQWLATGQWFSPVSSTNKTDSQDITEILLKVVLNIITLILTMSNPNLSGTSFCIWNKHVFSLNRLFPTLALYLSIYRILVYSGFCLDRFHCIKPLIFLKQIPCRFFLF